MNRGSQISLIKRMVSAVGILLTAVALTGCGKGGDKGSNNSYGYGNYGNGYYGGGGGGLCIQRIGDILVVPFQAQQFILDTYPYSDKLIAGYIPGYNQAFGQVNIGGGGSSQYSRYYGANIFGSQINMDIQTQAAGIVNGNGSIRVSTAEIQEILMMSGGSFFGGSFPNPTNGPYGVGAGYTQVCVTAVSMYLREDGGRLSDGTVYLFLNNSNHGYGLSF